MAVALSKTCPEVTANAVTHACPERVHEPQPLWPATTQTEYKQHCSRLAVQ